jgi:hypothetical protein
MASSCSANLRRMVTRYQDKFGRPLTMKNASDEISRWFVIVSVITMGSVICNCTASEKPNPSTASQNSQTTSLSESRATSSLSSVNQDSQATPDLLALVKSFAEGENGDEAWRKLQAYPREKLIESLLSLQKSVPEDDLHYYQIAFTLASLNYQYADNVKVLTHSLIPKPDNCADDVAVMVSRLIRAGDKNLMPVLFSSAPQSDAALAEALSDIFAQEFRDDPKEFLAQLSKVPRATRLMVYTRTGDGGLTENDVDRLRRQLAPFTHDQSLSRVVKEMLSSSVFKDRQAPRR